MSDKAMQLKWADLVAETVREFVPTDARMGADGPAGELDVADRLRRREGYALAHGQFACGATERVVRQLLRRELMEMTGHKPSA